ncbi:hypothetical protein QJQ45_017011 [Haematococcus lacustris]|nr:hypothetical protein QJQ45_017011 [Haematococcus lacustris]
MSTEPVALPLRLALTAAAAATAETVTYPIDFIKTRLQLQVACTSTPYTPQGEVGLGTHPASPPRPAGPGPAPPRPHPSRLSALQLTRSVIQREGVSGLYAGLAPAALRHVFYSGTRILVYEQLRGSWSRMGKAPAAEQQLGAQAAPRQPPSPHTHPTPGLGLGGAMLLGATAGAAGQLVAVPADLVKVRMQADGRLVAAGLLAAPRYQGVADALRKIVAAEGVRGLWRGCAPAVQRAALVNLGELATYDLAKQALVRHTGLDPPGPGTAAAASLCSGLVASLVSCPADVVKTRVMNQAGSRAICIRPRTTPRRRRGAVRGVLADMGSTRAVADGVLGHVRAAAACCGRGKLLDAHDTLSERSIDSIPGRLKLVELVAQAARKVRVVAEEDVLYYQPQDLSGKVALITGASSGFGEAIAHRFAELGMRLVLVARREERLRALAALLAERHGCEAHVVVQDVCDTAAVEGMVEALPASFQEVHVLVNNAGLVFGTPAAQEVDMGHVKTMFETNILAVIALTKACLKPAMRHYPGGGVYNATKFALSAYTTATRHDLVGTNIRVTAISPGAVETEFSLVRFAGDAARAAAVYEGEGCGGGCPCRPPHVQIADLIVTSVHQSGAKYLARPLLQASAKQP